MQTSTQVVPQLHRIHAVLVGQRINLRPLARSEVLAPSPLTVAVNGGGQAVLYRFGVVAFIDVAPLEQSIFQGRIAELVTEPLDAVAFESLQVEVGGEGVESLVDGLLRVGDGGLPTLQVIADILAKSLVLGDYEQRLAATFDRVEPLAERLRSGRHGVRRARQLIQHIGETLQIQHRLVGRAEVGEKPDLLWERPDLERLYLRLEQEYEIRERQIALERKLKVISDTATTLLDLLQTQRTLRVEWYIVILIVAEIVLTLYELFLH